MNKDNDWQECIENFSSVSISSDKIKAKSLIETAKGRNEFLSTNKL